MNFGNRNRGNRIRQDRDESERPTLVPSLRYARFSVLAGECIRRGEGGEEWRGGASLSPPLLSPPPRMRTYPPPPLPSTQHPVSIFYLHTPSPHPTRLT